VAGTRALGVAVKDEEGRCAKCSEAVYVRYLSSKQKRGKNLVVKSPYGLFCVRVSSVQHDRDQVQNYEHQSSSKNSTISKNGKRNRLPAP
jgi:hypothetical protein